MSSKLLTVFGGQGHFWDKLNTGTVFGGGVPVSSWADSNNAAAALNLPSIRTFMNISGEYAIRQTGVIKRIDFRWRKHLDTGATQQIKFKVFRPLGSGVYRLIDETAWIDETGTNVADVTASYTGLSLSARVGDFLAISIAVTTGANFALWSASIADTAGSVYIGVDATGDQGGWSTFSANLNFMFSAYVDPPAFACIGDSIIRGSYSWDNHNTANGYDVVTYNIVNDPAYQIATQLRSSPLLTYQNGGVGSSTWNSQNIGYAQPMIDALPKVLIMAGGVNDIVTAGTSWEDTLTLMNAVLVKVRAASSPVHFAVAEILPCTDADDTEAATIRTWNANYAAWCTANGCTLVRCHDAMGKVRVSTGELDDLIDAYDHGDGIHLSAAGIAAHAAAMAPDLRSIP